MNIFSNIIRRRFHDCPINSIQPLRLLLLGSPGSGKGTQSERLKKHFGVSHLSSGDMLRRNINNQTNVGVQAAEYVAKGLLVPDQVLISLVGHELQQVTTQNWLIDGFPRTLPQAVALDAMLQRTMQPLNMVIHLDVPEEVILDRIMNRWVHIPSGRVYNLSYNPPRLPYKDDVTGEPLSKRPDDCPTVFRERLAQYCKMAEPLLDHYSSIVVSVSGKTSDEIYPKIEREIVNRLGVLPGSTATPCISSTAAAAVARYHREQTWRTVCETQEDDEQGATAFASSTR